MSAAALRFAAAMMLDLARLELDNSSDIMLKNATLFEV